MKSSSQHSASSWRRRKGAAKHATLPLAQPPPIAAWLVGHKVPRLRWDDPEVASYLRKKEPVILQGCPLARGLIGRWSHSWLSANAGDYDGLGVQFVPYARTSFARFYGRGLGKGGCTPMSFAKFANVAAEEESAPTRQWRYYLQAPLVWNASASSGAGTSLDFVRDANAPGLHFAPLDQIVRTDVRTRIDWEWLAAVREAAGCPQFDSATLWAGRGGGSTPLHIDHVSNFFAQLVGRKRLLLFPPSQSFHLYPYPVHHPAGKDFAMASVESPEDVRRLPAFARARGAEALVEAGDVLFLPSRWWHYVRQLDEGDENLSLNFWSQPEDGADTTSERLQHTLEGATPPSARELATAAMAAARAAAQAASSAEVRAQQEAADEALLAGDDEAEALLWRHLGVVVEGVALDHFGIDASGEFLNGLASGADATNGGAWPVESPLREAASTIRAQIIAVLGTERSNALLRLMTRHGRLHPGLAPATSSPIVNAEAGQHTSEREIRRMRAIASGEAAVGGGTSPFL